MEGPQLSSKPPVKPDAPDLPAELTPVPSDAGLAGLAVEGALLERLDFSGAAATEICLDGCRLAQVDLTGAAVGAALLRDIVVAGGSWANLRSDKMRLRRVAFRGVRMTGATLSGASLEDVSFSDCRIDLAAFRSAGLTRVRFDGCRLDEVDFTGAKLASVQFSDCVLARALWAEATLSRCEMRGTDISGAANPERLRGVRMPWTDVLASAAVLAEAVGVEIVE